MPFVNIRIVKEVIEDDPVGKKAKISRGVSASICDATGIDAENVWIVFEEVSEKDWFVGKDRVAELRQ